MANVYCTSPSPHKKYYRLIGPGQSSYSEQGVKGFFSLKFTFIFYFIVFFLPFSTVCFHLILFLPFSVHTVYLQRALSIMTKLLSVSWCRCCSVYVAVVAIQYIHTNTRRIGAAVAVVGDAFFAVVDVVDVVVAASVAVFVVIAGPILLKLRSFCCSCRWLLLLLLLLLFL